MVPAAASPRASMTSTSPGPTALDRALLGVHAAAVIARTGPRAAADSAASGRRRPAARPAASGGRRRSRRVAGRACAAGRTSVATATRRSRVRASSVEQRLAGRDGGAGRTPASRARPVDLAACAPYGASARSRDDRRCAAGRCSTSSGAGASTSTSTTSPGRDHRGAGRRAGEDDVAGLQRDQSGTGRRPAAPKGNSSVAVVSSCTSSPLTQVRSRSGGRVDRRRASSSRGPSGVKPSAPLERRLEPRSAYAQVVARRSRWRRVTQRDVRPARPPGARAARACR